MKSILTADRRHQIAQLLLSEGSIKVGQLAEQFGVSTETIRKDLIYLENEGIAKKSHGGAIAAVQQIARPVDLKQTDHIEEKKRIAAAALQLIPPASTLIIDAGSTNYALAQLLSLEKGHTIFTNSLLVMQTLIKSEHRLFCFGGLALGGNHGIVGKWANEQVRSIRADLAFIGTDGFLGLSGPATADFEEAEFKHNIVVSSARPIILTDSSKFTNRTLFEFCHWEEIDTLITDTNAPSDLLFSLKPKVHIVAV